MITTVLASPGTTNPVPYVDPLAIIGQVLLIGGFLGLIILGGYFMWKKMR